MFKRRELHEALSKQRETFVMVLVMFEVLQIINFMVWLIVLDPLQYFVTPQNPPYYKSPHLTIIGKKRHIVQPRFCALFEFSGIPYKPIIIFVTIIPSEQPFLYIDLVAQSLFHIFESPGAVLTSTVCSWLIIEADNKIWWCEGFRCLHTAIFFFYGFRLY